MKKWIINEVDIKKLHSNDFLNRLLTSRGITDPNEIDNFLNPSIGSLYNPFLLMDMDRAIERIDEVVKKGQKIVIYGDYDVDGITSTSMLFRAFKKLGIDVSYYIPDRVNEGYGMNFEAVDYLKSLGMDLIITVDCGISAIEEVEYIKSIGMDVIITDHHECREEIPNTIVINPKREDCTYPCKNLAGCGVAFKLIQALWMYYEIDGVEEFLDIAAIGTIADIVDLKGENRIIAKNGIDKIRNSDKCGIIAIKEISNIENEVSAGDIAFKIAPRINAIGRLRDAKIAVELFVTGDYDKAIQIAKYLDRENKRRQKIEEDILNEALIKVENEIDFKKDRAIILCDANWHIGVVGIVASKIVEIYNRPVILLCEKNGIAKGSGRSIKGFNLFDALCSCHDILEGYGGHELAAGLKIDTSKINEFKEKINSFGENISLDTYMKKIRVDMKVDTGDINFDNLEKLKTLEPFGMGNPTPILGIEDVTLISKKYIGNGEKHIKLELSKSGINYEGVLFNFGKEYEDKNWKQVDIAFNMSENNWNNKRSIQLVVKDIKPYKNWIRENLYENYYKYLKAAINNNLDNNLDCSINKLKHDINFMKEFMFFEKGYILINSIESLKEIEDMFDNFNISINKNTGYNSQIIICPDIDKIDFNDNDVLIYDFLPGFYEYNLLNKKTKGKIYNFYNENTLNKIDIFENDIIIDGNLIENITSTLEKEDIIGNMTSIGQKFNTNPYKIYALVIALRKLNYIKVLSKGDVVKLKLVGKEDIGDILFSSTSCEKINQIKNIFKEVCGEE